MCSAAVLLLVKLGGQVWLEVLTVIVCSAAVLLQVKFGRQAALASRRSAIATMATAEGNNSQKPSIIMDEKIADSAHYGVCNTAYVQPPLHT